MVAAEVSKLAEISKRAAAEIIHLSAEGKEIADATSRMLTELLPEIERTKDLVQGISASSDEQSAGAAQVNLAVQQLDKVIQQNAAASEQIAAMAGNLSVEAKELQRTIRFFQMVDGQANGEADGAEPGARRRETASSLPSLTHSGEASMPLDRRRGRAGAEVILGRADNGGGRPGASEIESGDFRRY